MSEAVRSETRLPNSAALSLIRTSMTILSRVAPRAASRVAIELFARPRRFARPERERKLLEGAERIDIMLGTDTQIAAWRWGHGPLVILAHGWEGRGSQMAPFAAPLVEAGYSVVAFDAPAHGESSGKRSSLPHFAWALRGVAAELGAPHTVIAHSLGCAATTLAVRDGLAAQRLVFVAPPLNPSDYTQQFGAMFGLDSRAVRGLQQRVEERFLRLWSDYSLAVTAPRMTTPLLIVHDTDDDETPWSGGEQLAAAWPRARLHTTTGLGHRRVLRNASVVDTVVRFVTETHVGSGL